jgi:hypothetical protein
MEIENGNFHSFLIYGQKKPYIKTQIYFNPGKGLLMARSAIYFGINAFGEIAATKIALGHQLNQ